MTKTALSTTLTLMAAAFGLSLLGGIAVSTPASACYTGKPCPPPKANSMITSDPRAGWIKADPSPKRPVITRLPAVKGVSTGIKTR